MAVASPRGSVASTVLLCLSLLAVGCDGDANAEQTPSPTQPLASTPASAPPTTATATPSATPTTRPKPAPPVIPPAATKGLTVTSAEAFARFYLAALDYSRATGDGSLLRRWAGPTCVYCRGFADANEQIYKRGGAVTGDIHTRIITVPQARLVGASRALVEFKAQTGSTSWRPRPGAAATPDPSRSVAWKVYLVASKGQWTTFEMEYKE